MSFKEVIEQENIETTFKFQVQDLPGRTIGCKVIARQSI